MSGVSGGSVTAAYFALHGRDTLGNFRQKFLIQDAESSLSTSVNVTNLVLLAKGGVNDRSGLPTWLDEKSVSRRHFQRRLEARAAPNSGSMRPTSTTARLSFTTR